MDENKYSLTDHLTELRGRLIKSMLGIVLTTVIAAIFSTRIFEVAIKPLARVLADRNRVDVVLVADDPNQTEPITTALRARDDVRLHDVLPKLDGLRAVLADAAELKHPIDLVVVSGSALGTSGELATDILEGIEPSPAVAYLLKDPRDPRIAPMMLEGSSVILEPLKSPALARLLRRSAATAGKSAAGDKLVVLSPLEPFFAYMKISLVCGLFLACPIWLFQLWRFVEPGLYPTEKGFIGPVVVSGSVLFMSGGAFAYFLIFPAMFDVLINQMMPGSLSGAFTVENYLALLIQVTVAFGLVFELPLAIALLAALGIVTPALLRRMRKYWIIVAFIIGGVLTPTPDPLNQCLMAAPLILFYEVGIILAGFVGNRRRVPEQLPTPPT